MSIYTKLAEEGYPYSCCCGESYSTEAAAWSCKKCRQYLFEKDFLDRVVYHTDPKTGLVKTLLVRTEEGHYYDGWGLC